MGNKSWLKSVKSVFKSSPSSKDSNKWTERSSSQAADEGEEMPEIVSVEHFPADTSMDGEADEEEREHATAAVAAVAKVVRRAGYERLSREEKAAVFVQSCYRGYLARRARRALKGLVRLQALVRGHNVRKQAQMTMQCMQSLLRVQALVRAQRLQVIHNHRYIHLPGDCKHAYHMNDLFCIGEEDVDNNEDDNRRTYPIGSSQSPYFKRGRGNMMESQWRHDAVVDQEGAFAYSYSCLELEPCMATKHQLRSRDRNAALPASSYTIVPNTVEIDTDLTKFSKRCEYAQHEEEERSIRMQRTIPSYMAATQSAKAKARAHDKADGQRRMRCTRRHSGYSQDSSCGGDDRILPFVGRMGRKEQGRV